jgi:putative membrane protein
MSFIVKIMISTLAVLITAWLLPGVEIDNNSFLTALIVAVVLSFLNTVVKPILIFLTIPITILTLGLFLIVINACLILFASRLVDGFHVRGFFWAFMFSLIVSLITSIFEAIKKSDER